MESRLSINRSSENGSRDASVRSLDKALYVLESLSEVEGDIDLATLTKEVELPKSTLLRLLRTMEKHKLVRQDTSTKRFSLGIGLIALGKAAEKNISIVGLVRPFLVSIAEKTGETVSLIILDKGRAVYVDQVVSKNMIRGNTKLGLSLDLHSSSGGKVLLSGMDDEKIAELYQKIGFAKKTENTVDNIDELLNEIKKVRSQGYATDDEEVEIGGRCVAAPVDNKEGLIVAAVSVMGPTTRIRKQDFTVIAKVVKEEVLKASRSLGYNPN